MRTQAGEVRAARLGAVLASIVALILCIAVASASADSPLPPVPPRPADYVSSVPTDGEEVQPPTPGEVTASEQTYGELSDGQALDVAETAFAPVLSAELVPELDLPSGTEVGKYLSLYTARVDPVNGPSPAEQALSDKPSPSQFLESWLPLRAPDDGSLRPLDGDLVEESDHYEADNPVVNSQIPVALSDGASLPHQDVSLTPLGVDPVDAVPTEDDKLFYPNATADTDFLIAPTALGFEVFMQLRSPESPEHYEFKVGMPDGAELLPTEAGGAKVVNGGETLATIEPPSAADAVGQVVPTSYGIEGDRLSVDVEHRDANFQLPILVDPPVNGNVDEYAWVPNNPTPDLQWWSNATNFAGGFSSFYHSAEGGLMNRALGGSSPRSYPAYSFGEWVAASPRRTWIERIDLLNLDSSPTAPGACTVVGIFNPYQASWASTTIKNLNTNTQTTSPGMAYCGNLSHQSYSIYVGQNDVNDGAGGDPEAAVGSQGIFMLQSVPGGRTNNAENLRQAKVFRYDEGPATITGTNASSNWTEGPVRFDVQDLGLGAYGVYVFKPASFDILGSSGFYCTGNRSSFCPTDSPYWVNNLPEGEYPAVAVGVDPLIQGGGATSWTARIDRTPPDVGQPTGSLYDQRASIDSEQAYTLDVSGFDSATGGEPSSDQQRRSGVKRIDVYLGNSSTPAFSTENAACNLAGGACPYKLQATWNIDPATLPEGTSTVHVVATDELDHHSTSTSRDFQINVKTSTAIPAVTLTPSTADSAGNFTLHVDVGDGATFAAADPNQPFGPGIRDIQLYVDGAPFGAAVPSNDACPQGGCGMTYDYQLSSAQDLSQHEVLVVARDRANGSGSNSAGQRQGKAYRYFGYMDAFNELGNAYKGFPLGAKEQPQNRRMTRVAQNGGANVVRIPIDCFGDYGNGNSPNDRNQFTATLFSAVHEINRDAGAVVLHTLPVMGCGAAVNSPDSPGNPLARYRDQVQFIADEIAADPENGVLAIEIANEPNLEPFWLPPPPTNVTVDSDFTAPTPAQIADLAKAAYLGVKGSGVKLVLPSMSPIGYVKGQGPKNVGTVVPSEASSVSQSIDGLALTKAYVPMLSTPTTLLGETDVAVPDSKVIANSLHLYAGPRLQRKGLDLTLSTYRDYLDSVRSAVRPYGDAGNDSLAEWVTETGYPSSKPLQPGCSDVQDEPAMTSRNFATCGTKAPPSTPSKQYSRIHDSFIEFEKRQSLEMWLVYRVFDDTVPYDGMPDDGGDGAQEGNFGLFNTSYENDQVRRFSGRSIYCKLNALENNPDAKYSDIPSSFNCPARGQE